MNEQEQTLEAAATLLTLLGHQGVVAVLLLMDGQTLSVMCQDAGDVLPLCNRVAAEHYMPPDKTKH